MALSKIQSESVNLADNFAFTGTVTGAGGGKLLQIIPAYKTDQMYVSGTAAYVEISTLTTSITPSATSSKILVQASLSIAGEGFFDLYMTRTIGSTATTINVGDANGSRIRSTHHSYEDTGYIIDSVSVSFLDSPNTTSAATYKFYIGTPHSAGYDVYVNRSHQWVDATYSATTSSSLVLMEIGV